MEGSSPLYTEATTPKERLFYYRFSMPFIACVYVFNTACIFLFRRLKINQVSEYDHAFILGPVHMVANSFGLLYEYAPFWLTFLVRLSLIGNSGQKEHYAYSRYIKFYVQMSKAAKRMRLNTVFVNTRDASDFNIVLM